jgi:hypothetical protein
MATVKSIKDTSVLRVRSTTDPKVSLPVNTEDTYKSRGYSTGAGKIDSQDYLPGARQGEPDVDISRESHIGAAVTYGRNQLL